MDTRKKDSQSENEKSSTSKITTFLQINNENNAEETDRYTYDWLNQGTMSYRPDKPPTFTEYDMRRFAELEKDIRTDGWNLRLDEKRQMYFYLPKDHPEYKDYSPDVEENDYSNSSGCIIS